MGELLLDETLSGGIQKEAALSQWEGLEGTFPSVRGTGGGCRTLGAVQAQSFQELLVELVGALSAKGRGVIGGQSWGMEEGCRGEVWGRGKGLQFPVPRAALTCGGMAADRAWPQSRLTAGTTMLPSAGNLSPPSGSCSQKP